MVTSAFTRFQASRVQSNQINAQDHIHCKIHCHLSGLEWWDVFICFFVGDSCGESRQQRVSTVVACANVMLDATPSQRAQLTWERHTAHPTFRETSRFSVISGAKQPLTLYGSVRTVLYGNYVNRHDEHMYRLSRNTVGAYGQHIYLRLATCPGWPLALAACACSALACRLRWTSKSMEDHQANYQVIWQRGGNFPQKLTEKKNVMQSCNHKSEDTTCRILPPLAICNLQTFQISGLKRKNLLWKVV